MIREAIARLSCVLCVTLCCACIHSPSQPSHVQLGQLFELRAGASAALPDGFTVTFDHVRSDSRCPIDVVCIWAGDAVVAVTLSPPAGGALPRDVHTNADGSEATGLGHTIKLVALAPYPRSDRPIQPNHYVATLTVRAQ